VVDDRLFSDQVKMIPGHAQTTRCPESCSRRRPTAISNPSEEPAIGRRDRK
jgi:hypothetical protein